jgi:4-alpha-glucanotransferase
MKADGYKWWIKRIDAACRIYNVLRIDHFRGFDSYYAIPYGETTAINGEWRQGPGIELFKAVEKKLGKKNIIAEDLGFLTDSVRNLLRESGYPGMKVLEFAFDSRDSNNNDYLPHMYPVNCIAYAGTHDNDTIMGWMKTADKEDVKYAKEYLVMGKEEPYWDMIRALWSSVAGTTIIQAQDLLGLGSESRMNIPSTLGGNWSWRAMPKAFNAKIANRLFRLTKLYGRLK